MNANKWSGVGRVSMTPELKSYENQKGEEGFRCFFRVAITGLSDRGKKEARTSFIPIVAWGKAAQRHAQYLEVGTEVYVEGELIVDAQRNDQGRIQREFIYVQANDVQYGRKSQKNQNRDSKPTRTTRPASRSVKPTQGVNVEDTLAELREMVAALAAGKQPFQAAPAAILPRGTALPAGATPFDAPAEGEMDDESNEG